MKFEDVLNGYIKATDNGTALSGFNYLNGVLVQNNIPAIDQKKAVVAFAGSGGYCEVREYEDAKEHDEAY